MRKYFEIALTGWFFISLIPGPLFAYFPVSVNDRDETRELEGNDHYADVEWLKCCEHLQSEGLKDEGGWEFPV